jgi:hypothetical protein
MVFDSKVADASFRMILRVIIVDLMEHSGLEIWSCASVSVAASLSF